MKKQILSGLLICAVSVFGKGTVGEDVTRFEFADSPPAAEWYNGYTHSFFTNRIDIGPTIFPREYLAIADSWLNDAQCDQQTIQEFSLASTMLSAISGLTISLLYKTFSTSSGMALLS